MYDNTARVSRRRRRWTDVTTREVDPALNDSFEYDAPTARILSEVAVQKYSESLAYIMCWVMANKYALPDGRNECGGSITLEV